MDKLTTALRNNVVVVTFKKVDGTVRKMRATTDTSRFIYESKTTGERKRNDTVTVLWDMDKGQWRSMRNDSLIEWQVEG